MNADEEQPFVQSAEDIEKLKRAAAVCERVTDATRRCLVSIAGIISHEEGSFQGTGTIVELGGKVLLVTAQHVIAEIEAKGFQGVAYSCGNDKLYARAPQPFVMDAGLDVAGVRIAPPTQPDSDRIPCPKRLIAASSQGIEKDLLFVHGFPEKCNRYFKMLPGIISETRPLCSGLGTPKWPKFDPAIHFAVSYSVKFLQDAEGKIMDWIDPHGMSGAVVWNIRRAEIGSNWTPDDARIVGIVQRWDQDGQCLIATRVEHAIPFLRKC